MSTGIAIIGDNFMRADVLESALRGAVSAPFTCAKLDLPFPDEPIVQRSERPELAGLREFQGTRSRWSPPPPGRAFSSPTSLRYRAGSCAICPISK